MRKIVLLFFTAVCAPSCTQHENLSDSTFYFNLTISNPAQSFKISLSIRPHPHIPRQGRMYLRRMDENSTILDYRENGILRKKMLDTVNLDTRTFGQFFDLINKAGAWELKNDIGKRTDGNAYHFTLRDSAREHAFSLMGTSDNEYLQKLSVFCLDLFETYYPKILIADHSSEIDLKKIDRKSHGEKVFHIRIIQSGDSIKFNRNDTLYSVSWDRFIVLWRILENNHALELESNTEFSEKYPVEYRLFLRRGDVIRLIVVMAPSKLKDKRYLNVINAIESL